MNTTNASPIAHRRDIDGLRGIAVLSVILFHINPSWLPGGFVGVDIFFVLSGYLISLNLFNEMNAGRFSLAEFYRRRIKRIAPAMLAVIGLTVIICQFVMRPEDAEKTAEASLWALASFANVYFWLFQDTSYFAADSALTPLLHLWSLGVEEQFYIVWPLILMAFYRRLSQGWLLKLTVFVALCSFLLGEWYFHQDPSFVYYMLPSRAGELLVGALLALMHANNLKIAPFTAPSGLLSGMGFLGLSISLVLYNEHDVFPGLRALLPTLSTAFLLHAGRYEVRNLQSLLCFRPLTGLGIISYSAYLWHWPLLALYRYGHNQIDLPAGMMLFALTLLLGWGSWRFIEQPFRYTTASALQVFIRQFAVPAMLLGCFAIAAMKLDGYGLRYFSPTYKEQLQATRKNMRPAYDYNYVCQRQHLLPDDLTNTYCVLGEPTNSAPQAILWGDSNAAHYVGMVGVFAHNVGFKFRNIAVGACPPVLSDPEPYVEATRLKDCRAAISQMSSILPKYSTVIISANWLYYYEKSNQFWDDFFRTMDMLKQQGKLVILIGKAPAMKGYDRLCHEKALSYPGLNCPNITFQPTSDILAANDKLKSFAESHQGVEYFDVTPFLCANNLCSVYDPQSNPIYYDAHHLTLAGSWALGRKIIDSMQGQSLVPFSLIPTFVNPAHSH